MTQRKRYAVLGFAIFLVGALKMPFEQKLREELTAAYLMPPKVEQRTGEKIGQTFSAVSLGGLRTLVATFLNLRAFHFFTEQRWGEVADTYELIVDLAPRTQYYWDTGSWHQAYNAASYYLYDSKLPPLRRKANWRASILRGREFLERGTQNCPHDAKLRHRLGILLSDPNKIGAFGKHSESYWQAYQAFLSATQMPKPLSFSKRFALYSLVRVDGKEKEARDLLHEIQTESSFMPPTMQVLAYMLEYQKKTSRPVSELIDSIFPNRPLAYQSLKNQWLRSAREHFPVHGLAEGITFLEKELKLPEEQRTFYQKLPTPLTPDDFLKSNPLRQ